MDIIIYGSLHGAAKRYAEGLAERTGLKAVDYKEVEPLIDAITSQNGIPIH